MKTKFVIVHSEIILGLNQLALIKEKPMESQAIYFSCMVEGKTLSDQLVKLTERKHGFSSGTFSFEGN
jgi:hypothetical protein